ncbi:MAG: hypothetical protein GY868_02770 [Deltaproteobacteria bacterium]|nr:hypothetical protein [Deltaproteobacteria bacterium]
MSVVKWAIIVVAALSTLSACSRLHMTWKMTTKQTFRDDQSITEVIKGDKFLYKYFPNKQESYSFEFQYPTYSAVLLEREVKSVRAKLRRMAEELVGNLEQHERGTRLQREDILLLSTTFVNIDDLYQTSSFGRYCSEQLANDLSTLGMEVVELRKTNQLMIQEKTGVLGISRVSDEIRKQFKANTLMVGTYTVTPYNVILNVRLVDADSKKSRVRCAATGDLRRKNNLLVNYLLARISSLKTRDNQFAFGDSGDGTAALGESGTEIDLAPVSRSGSLQ